MLFREIRPGGVAGDGQAQANKQSREREWILQCLKVAEAHWLTETDSSAFIGAFGESNGIVVGMQASRLAGKSGGPKMGQPLPATMNIGASFPDPVSIVPHQ